MAAGAGSLLRSLRFGLSGAEAASFCRSLQLLFQSATNRSHDTQTRAPGEYDA